MTTSQKTRAIETHIDIEAPVEAVWAALTEAEELTRWFPMQAKVTPGVGGSIWMSWDGTFSGEGKIDIWEPNQRLRTRYEMPGADGTPLQITHEYVLEGKGGTTHLRLVHAGFSPDAVWDELFDATRRGWQFELRGLRHYIEHHRGSGRRVVWVRRVIDGTPSEGWARIMGTRGLVAEGSVDALAEGDRYEVRAADGSQLSGQICVFGPPLDFAATVEELNDAYLRLRIDRACSEQQGSLEAHLWLSTYGLSEDEVERVEQRYGALLDQALA
ncbi:MAG: SRPBCC family protein [Planctomycetota bacterium]|jgi:uncharacterized protein YndB with AHSA1/START domain